MPRRRYVGTVPYYTRRSDVPIQSLALGVSRDAIVLEDVPVRAAARRIRSLEVRGAAVVSAAHGETVDLFAATTHALAQEIASLFADRSKTREVGILLGYPACCVDAFVESPFPGGDDFAHFLRGLRGAARPRAMLNALTDVALVPFHPCRLDCPHALRFARGVMSALPKAARPTLLRALSAPILRWSDRDVAIFDGAPRARGLRYRRFVCNAGAPDASGRRLLVAALDRGDTVSLDGPTLVVRARGRIVGQTSFAPRRPVLVRWR